MQKLVTSFKFINIENVIISIYVFIGTWVVSLIICDQEDESTWKILATKNWLPDIAFKT